ncbi:unnamed protein product [Microthlaspi erraticum]|uniref:Uncharacterized protein n=1 Tax=Microthlaspi erraticum TaxID=1685480 RepID=A0A6D2KGI7_9BRAS|nr:unnamed protein product [Microthlaspi erraticum]
MRAREMDSQPSDVDTWHSDLKISTLSGPTFQSSLSTLRELRSARHVGPISTVLITCALTNPPSMGLLDHLWDDTVAGPRPENGLGKLRKHHTFSFRPSSGNDQPDGGTPRSYGDDSPEDAVKVTRSIMIIKPPGYQGGSAPVSPAGSTPPVSPFSGGKEPFRFRRRSTSDDKAAAGVSSECGPRSSPPSYGL